jgi:outer membrane lipoprotein-sorting protein
MQAVFDRLFVFVGRGAFADATRDYDVALVGPAALKLTPKGGALKRQILEVEVRFDAAWQVAFVLVRERSGDQTQITFANLKRNVPIPDSAFR